jgi:hypothetical protein
MHKLTENGYRFKPDCLMARNTPKENPHKSRAQELKSLRAEKSEAEKLSDVNSKPSLALLQPTCFPDLYYLSAQLRSDRLILQETEPFSRKGHVHRGLIRTPAGTQWIHVPVPGEDRGKPIGEVRLAASHTWHTKLMETLAYNYRNSLYFDHYEPEIRADFEIALETENLAGFIRHLNRRLFGYLGEEHRADWASEVKEYTPDPDELAERLGASHLWQEQDGRHYQRQALRRETMPFTHPVYRQHFGGFEPGCCLYDLLFQEGPESCRVIGDLL